MMNLTLPISVGAISLAAEKSPSVVSGFMSHVVAIEIAAGHLYIAAISRHIVALVEWPLHPVANANGSEATSRVLVDASEFAKVFAAAKRQRATEVTADITERGVTFSAGGIQTSLPAVAGRFLPPADALAWCRSGAGRKRPSAVAVGSREWAVAGQILESVVPDAVDVRIEVSSEAVVLSRRAADRRATVAILTDPNALDVGTDEPKRGTIPIAAKKKR